MMHSSSWVGLNRILRETFVLERLVQKCTPWGYRCQDLLPYEGWAFHEQTQGPPSKAQVKPSSRRGQFFCFNKCISIVIANKTTLVMTAKDGWILSSSICTGSMLLISVLVARMMREKRAGVSPGNFGEPLCVAWSCSAVCADTLGQTFNDHRQPRARCLSCPCLARDWIQTIVWSFTIRRACDDRRVAKCVRCIYDMHRSNLPCRYVSTLSWSIRSRTTK